MKKLFLDDLRTVEMVYPDANLKEWVIVRDFYQFVNYINRCGLPDYISFDHDLGLEHMKFTSLIANWTIKGMVENPPDPSTTDFKEKTGYDAAKWLVDYVVKSGKKLPEYFVHSHNPIGAQNIRDYLKNAEKHLDV